MTQKISLNKSVPFNMFLFTIRKSLGFTAVATVLSIILSPFYTVSWLNDQKENLFSERVDFFGDMFFPASVFLAIGACLFFIVLLYINFSFLYSKSSSDAYHSMPITRTKLLLSRFFASFICSLIPLIAAYIGFIAVALDPVVSADISHILISGLFTAFMMLFCGAFTLLFVITAGTVFDSVVSFAVVNVGLPLICFLILGMCEDNLYGCVSIQYDLYVRYVSPFAWALISFLYFLTSPDTVNCFAFWPTVAVAVLTAALLCAAVLLYKRRKSEKAGEAYAFGFMHYIIGTVVSIVCYFILGAIFADDRLSLSFWLSGAIGAIIGAVIYNAVTNRGFKKISKAAVSGAVAIAIIGLTTMSVAFDFFGFEDFVPKNNDITRVTIGYRGMEMDADDVTNATNLHKIIVAEKPDVEHYMATYDYGKMSEWVSFTYKLKNGKTVERRYIIPFGFAIPEKVEIIKEDLLKELNNQFDKFLGKEFTLEGNFDKYSENDKRYVVEINREEAEKLIAAYVNDVSEAQESVLFAKNYYETPTLHIHGSYVENKYTSGSSLYTEYDSFNFSFYCAQEYTEFHSVMDSLNIEERNTAYSETK